nr:transposase [Blautia luti]
MEQCGVLSEFKGIAMHDCWASYWNYPDIQHAVCCAHFEENLNLPAFSINADDFFL